MTAVAIDPVACVLDTVAAEHPRPPRTVSEAGHVVLGWNAHPELRHAQGASKPFTQLVLTGINSNNENGGSREATSLFQQSFKSVSTK